MKPAAREGDLGWRTVSAKPCPRTQLPSDVLRQTTEAVRLGCALEHKRGSRYNAAVHVWPQRLVTIAQDPICHRERAFPVADPFSARYSGVASHSPGSIERYGRVPFEGFYAKRVRRIVRASFFVLVVSLLLAAVLYPPLLMG